MSKFKVRDFRDKGFFLLDDAFLNDFARHLGPTASMVYVSLCRHANKEQKSFPSQELIAEELGINPQVVKRKIRLLEEWNIISKYRTRNKKGKFMYNTYYLLDKSEWRKPQAQKVPVDRPQVQKVPKPQVQKVYYKETHNKGTHINNRASSVVDKNSFFVDNSNSYFSPIGGILKRKETFPGASYEWQDFAVRFAGKLGIEKPSSSWFKFFQTAFEKKQVGVLQATFSAVADANPTDPEKYFFKVFRQKLAVCR